MWKMLDSMRLRRIFSGVRTGDDVTSLLAHYNLQSARLLARGVIRRGTRTIEMSTASGRPYYVSHDVWEMAGSDSVENVSNNG